MTPHPRYRDLAVRRWAIRTALTAAGLAFFLLILWFPIATRPLIARVSNWAQLSDAGQAYGGISAVLSGLAFCGISVSLAFQWRQTRLAQVISARERHFELTKLGLEKPHLSYQKGPDESDESYGRQVVVNLWMAHWKMLWDLGDMDGKFLHQTCTELFLDKTAVEWWRRWGAGWAPIRSRASRQFVRIVEDCYQHAPLVVSAATASAQAAAPMPEDARSPETPQ
jgi:uncharacterized protein DUF6082